MRGLVEIVPVQDVYVSGIGAIEHVGGGNVRITLYVNQENDDGKVEKVVAAKFIGPSSALPDAIMSLVVALGGKMVGIVPSLSDLVN